MNIFNPIHSTQKHAKLWRKAQKQSKRALKVVEEKPAESFLFTTWKTFAKNTSIHGVHYLIETSFNLMERVLWALLILLAFAGMFYCSILLSARFNSSKTSTVFESTEYKVSEIPFASVTVCNNNRLNYNKTDAAIEHFIANHSETDKNTFVKFLKIFQNMEFGSFDEYGVIRSSNVSFLDQFNVSVIYEFMMHSCEELFVSCWWRDKPFNCCERLSKQRCMYGICWSFNSLTNEGTNYIDVSSSIIFCAK